MLKRFAALSISTVLLSALTAVTFAASPAPTNFGQVPVESSATQTITFTGLSGSAKFSQQSGKSEFSIGTSVCSSGGCAVPVTFTPAYPGLRQGALVATDQSGALLATGLVYGVGTGPQISIVPGVISSAFSSETLVNGIALRSPGNLFVSDDATYRVYYINTQSGQVSPFVGNGFGGYSGDGGPALSAELTTPSGLAFDGAGNLYIADMENNVIRRVDAFTNVITTVAGKPGALGFSGDGGPATSAQLNSPTAIVVDVAGNLYIADAGNNRVREVLAANGKIVTVAGNGTPGYAGDHGPATSAELDFPFALAVDTAGHLYIADSNNSVIREVVSGVISTIAGTGTSGYSGDGGPATSAVLAYPQGVAVDAAGDIYIADRYNYVVRKVSGDSRHIISTVAGTPDASGYNGDGGASTTGTFRLPSYLTLDSEGNLFIVDGNDAIREVTATAAPLTFPPTNIGSTSAPITLTVSNTGNRSLDLSGLSVSGNFSQQSSVNACSASTTLPEGGSCTIAIAFSPTSGGNTRGTVTLTANSLNTSTATRIALSESAGLRFIPVTPCRVADTRYPNGPAGGPLISGGTSRDFAIPSSSCGIPSSAQAYSMNVTAVPITWLGYMTVWPAGQSRPPVSTLNSDGRPKANAAIIPAGAGGAISIYASNDTHLVLDIDGYFVAQSNPSALDFYSLTPCRVADTRTDSRPYISGNTTRAFNIQNGSCNVPDNTLAFSLNFTAVPHTWLGYLTTWVSGPQPLASTLNSVTGAVTANAAIVPADDGSDLNVYASNDTDLAIDINGYFALPANGGLLFYPVAPCRVLDTRLPFGSQPFSGMLNVNVSSSGCPAPSVAQSYVLNMTVVPETWLGYLAAWAGGSAQPLQSTLNASDGAVTSNMAIVPTTNGSISVFASNPTHLVVDIFGYMAP